MNGPIIWCITKILINLISPIIKKANKALVCPVRSSWLSHMAVFALLAQAVPE